MAFFARSQASGTAPPSASQVAQPSVLAYSPPSTRELRAQAVHRLQVGMFGLAGMLLLVSLANVIMDRAKYLDDTSVNLAEPMTSASETSAKDPLVDMGVAPELPVSGDGGKAPARPSSAAGAKGN
jgi:hypothetical protein